MGPDEFFGDCAFWYSAELIKEGSFLEVYVQTVAKAGISLAYERSLVDAEWEIDLASAVLEASEGCLANLLCEPQ